MAMAMAMAVALNLMARPAGIRFSFNKTVVMAVPIRFQLSSGSQSDENGKGHKEIHGALLRSAVHAASLRAFETRKPNPLFYDLYADCLIAGNTCPETEHSLNPSTPSSRYCLATKFIDDSLLSMVDHSDGPRQVVLLGDGMDTRPYRLKWPASTVIYNISPASITNIALEKLEAVGAKVPRNCMLLHVPIESSDIHDMLVKKGFDGSRPSIWVMQGKPLQSIKSFKNILYVVSSLATKGSMFVGELPILHAEEELKAKHDSHRWIHNLFMSNGLRVKVISYDEVAKKVHCDFPSGTCEDLLFVAHQLQLSDQQMENWRRELQRAEDEGDEEGFEDL